MDRLANLVSSHFVQRDEVKMFSKSYDILGEWSCVGFLGFVLLVPLSQSSHIAHDGPWVSSAHCPRSALNDILGRY